MNPFLEKLHSAIACLCLLVVVGAILWNWNALPDSFRAPTGIAGLVFLINLWLAGVGSAID